MTDPKEMHLFDVDPAEEPAQHGGGDRHVEVEIHDGLGQLRVDRSGDLVGIDFDERVLRTSDPARVGDRLVAALREAAGRVAGGAATGEIRRSESGRATARPWR